MIITLSRQPAGSQNCAIVHSLMCADLQIHELPLCALLILCLFAVRVRVRVRVRARILVLLVLLIFFSFAICANTEMGSLIWRCKGGGPLDPPLHPPATFKNTRPLLCTKRGGNLNGGKAPTHFLWHSLGAPQPKMAKGGGSIWYWFYWAGPPENTDVSPDRGSQNRKTTSNVNKRR